MMRRNLLKVLSILCVLLVMIPFQNCGKQFVANIDENSLDSLIQQIPQIPETPQPTSPSAPSPVQTPPPPETNLPSWNINPKPIFTAETNSSYDLSNTLPTSVKKGGTFSVDPNGAPLPIGMVLSSSGILYVGTATAGEVSDVIFNYDEP